MTMHFNHKKITAAPAIQAKRAAQTVPKRIPPGLTKSELVKFNRTADNYLATKGELTFSNRPSGLRSKTKATNGLRALLREIETGTSTRTAQKKGKSGF